MLFTNSLKMVQLTHCCGIRATKQLVTCCYWKRQGSNAPLLRIGLHHGTAAHSRVLFLNYANLLLDIIIASNRVFEPVQMQRAPYLSVTYTLIDLSKFCRLIE